MKLSNGEIKTFRAVTTIVNAGVIVNKYVEGNDHMDLFISSNGTSNVRIEAVKFFSNTPWGFAEEFAYTNELITIHSESKSQPKALNIAVQDTTGQLMETSNVTGNLSSTFEEDENFFYIGGWAAINGVNAATTSIDVILQSDRHTYICETISGFKPSVNNLDKTFDYKKTGYYAFVPKKEILSGSYKVGIRITGNDTLNHNVIEGLQFTDKVIVKRSQLNSMVLPDF
jgi:hypothetical protein